MRRYLSLILLVLGIGALASLLYVNSPYRNNLHVFSPYTFLTSSWEKYKIRFINQDGRVIDYSQNSTTTSEGQSYALLQAVWMDDKNTFDKVWAWTKADLARPNDHLFGWRWGKTDESHYGLLGNGGDNTAADADNDIALALILAARRWENNAYLDDAKNILNDIWKIDTDTVRGKRYLIAGNWASTSDRLILNPSYFSPFAWRLFAKVDPQHDWNSLIDSSYEVLHNASQTNLDKGSNVGLPPDWVALSKSDGHLEAANLPDFTTAFGYNAMRVPWRIALDYKKFGESRAKNYLDSLTFLGNYFDRYGKLPSDFEHDGAVTHDFESPAMYAATLGYFAVSRPSVADKIYQDKILKLYSNDTNSFRDDLPYYEENWLWFGSALYLNYLATY